MIPFAGTALGSAFVFFLKKDIPEILQKILLGFASGVMVAASVWSLLIPSIEMQSGGVWPAVIGLLGGFAFLLLIGLMKRTSQAGTALRTIMNNLSGEVKICGSSIGEVTIATL